MQSEGVYQIAFPMCLRYAPTIKKIVGFFVDEPGKMSDMFAKWRMGQY
jgi:hypothetical protein